MITASLLRVLILKPWGALKGIPTRRSLSNATRFTLVGFSSSLSISLYTTFMLRPYFVEIRSGLFKLTLESFDNVSHRFNFTTELNRASGTPDSLVRSTEGRFLKHLHAFIVSHHLGIFFKLFILIQKTFNHILIS